MSTAVAVPPDKLEDFLGMLIDGEGPLTAGLACGLTPRKVREMEADPEISQLIAIAREQKYERYEKKLDELAMDGHFAALQMFLFCQAPHRGWRPPQQRVAHDHNGRVEVERVQATTQAVVALIREHGPGILAIGGPLDQAIEASASDG